MQPDSRSNYCLILLSLASFLFSTNSTAQFTGIGVETGPGGRILFGNEALKQNQHLAVGFTVGVNTTFKINTRFSLRSGIYYELKGGQSALYTVYIPPSQGGGQIQFRSRDNFHFVTLPLLFKVNLGKEKHWYANAGASVGYLLAARDVTLVKGGETSRGKYFSPLYSIEYSALLGFGYETKINDTWLGHLEIRDHVGLNNLLNVPIIVGNGSLKTHSCYLLAGLTYRLPHPW